MVVEATVGVGTELQTISSSPLVWTQQSRDDPMRCQSLSHSRCLKKAPHLVPSPASLR